MTEARRREVVAEQCRAAGLPVPYREAALSLSSPSSSAMQWTPDEVKEFQALLQRAGSVRRLLDILRTALGVGRDGEGLDPAAQSRRMQREWQRRDYIPPEPR
jgi:hypothetical protein